jgi:hypothetical protein
MLFPFANKMAETFAGYHPLHNHYLRVLAGASLEQHPHRQLDVAAAQGGTPGRSPCQVVRRLVELTSSRLLKRGVLTNRLENRSCSFAGLVSAAWVA